MDERRLTDEEIVALWRFVSNRRLPEGFPWCDVLRLVAEVREARASRARAGEAGPVVRDDWKCEAGTERCPGNNASLRKDWICGFCGRLAHAPQTWKDKGYPQKAPTYEPARPPSAGEGNEGTLCACGCGRTLVDSDRPGRLAYPCRVAAADAFVKAAAAPPPEEKP